MGVLMIFAIVLALVTGAIGFGAGTVAGCYQFEGITSICLTSGERGAFLAVCAIAASAAVYIMLRPRPRRGYRR